MAGVMPFDAIFAPAPATTRGQATVITADEKTGKLLYGSGRSVVIRSIADPLKAELFTEHSKDVTVARVAPSGAYVASGDAGGVVKIWSLDNPEHPVKYEGQCLAGAICDIAWSPDSQRVCAVGDGRDCMGRVFMWDSGSTVGEIAGHSKKILSCDFKQTRPFQILTASEDFQVNVFNGPPFKFVQSCKEHQKFVNCVRYSPDGSKFCTVGSDMKAFVYDTASLSKVGELKGHKGTINACAWSADGSKIVTVSADKTAMLWDAASFACGGTCAFGAPKPGPEDMQVGVVWTGTTIISLSLRGELTYLDAANMAPKMVIRGHNKNITALATDSTGGMLVSASYDGILNKFTIGKPDAQGLAGKGHTNAVVDLAVSGDMLVSCGLDDTLRVSSLSSFSVTGDGIPLGGAPSGLALANDGSLCVVTTNKAIVVLSKSGAGFAQGSSTPVPFSAQGVAISPNMSEVAVACDDNQIRTYGLKGTALVAGAALTQHKSPVTCVAYSPCGKFMASADAGKEVIIWEAASKAVKSSGMVFHQSKITCLDWGPDSRRVATGGLDSKIIVWDVEGGPTKKIVFERANVGGIAAIKFLSPGKFASAGADCSVKIWVV